MELFKNESYFNETVVEDYEANFLGLVCSVLPIITLVGNGAVLLAVKREKNLQNSTNFLIVSLAVADLLVGLIVMPWGIYALVSHQWHLPYVICELYMTIDVICSTASIFNLVAISVDRYHAIKHPIKYSQNQAVGNHKIIMLAIGLVWTISLAVGLPIIFGLNESQDEHSTTCEFRNPDFIICSSILSFYIPLIIIIFINVSIFKMIHDRDKAKKTKMKIQNEAKNEFNRVRRRSSAAKRAILKVSTSLPAETELQSPRSPKDAISPNNELESQCVAIDRPLNLNGIVLKEEDMKLVSSKSVQVKEIEAVEQQKKAKLASYQVDAMLSPCHAERKSRSSKVSFRPSSLGNPSEEELQVQVFATSSNNQPSNSHLERFRSRIRILSSGSFSSSDQGSPGKIGFSLATSSRILTRAKNWRSKGIQAKNERRERRATKTLAIVLGCFLICWIPFFFCNTMNAISIKWNLPEMQPSMNMFLITTWLGYINSIVNPFIYTIFNTDFRKAFKKIFHIRSEKN